MQSAWLLSLWIRIIITSLQSAAKQSTNRNYGLSKSTCHLHVHVHVCVSIEFTHNSVWRAKWKTHTRRIRTSHAQYVKSKHKAISINFLADEKIKELNSKQKENRWTQCKKILSSWESAARDCFVSSKKRKCKKRNNEVITWMRWLVHKSRWFPMCVNVRVHVRSLDWIGLTLINGHVEI